jgi:hypothetical protein
MRAYRDDQALLEAARGARLPEAERARLRAGMDARLAALAAVSLAAGAGAVATKSASAAAGVAGAKAGVMGLAGGAAKVFLACAVAAAVGVGGGTIIKQRRQAQSRAAPVVVARPQPAAPPAVEIPVVEEVKVAPPVEVQRPVVVTARPHVAKPAPRKPAPDPVSLAAEQALLRQAQAAIMDGDANGSVRKLDKPEQGNAEGAREEREAAWVLALCAAGRVQEARVLGRRFLAQRPASAQAAGIRRSCAFSRGGDGE